MRILLENIGLIPMSEEKAFIENAYLIIEGQYIKEVGEGYAPAGDYDQVIDGHDRVVLPDLLTPIPMLP